MGFSEHASNLFPFSNQMPQSQLSSCLSDPFGRLHWGISRVLPRSWRPLSLVVLWEAHCKCQGLVCTGVDGAKCGGKSLEDFPFFGLIVIH